MNRVIFTAFIATVSLAMGCAITDYPVITDSAGPWGDVVMDSYYDKAYILASAQLVTIWADGTDELYTLVVQDWMGDQHLYAYNSFNSSGTQLFLDQWGGYCDPARQSNQWILHAWNPNLPPCLPPVVELCDEPFDYWQDTTAPGARSLSLLVSYGPSSRYGECGSFARRNAQDYAREFALLEPTTFRGHRVYQLALNSSVAEIRLTAASGESELMPIYSNYRIYIDAKRRMIFQPTASWKYQARYLENWIETNGSQVDIDLTYGSLEVHWDARFWTGDGALSRL